MDFKALSILSICEGAIYLHLRFYDIYLQAGTTDEWLQKGPLKNDMITITMVKKFIYNYGDSPCHGFRPERSIAAKLEPFTT